MSTRGGFPFSFLVLDDGTWTFFEAMSGCFFPAVPTDEVGAVCNEMIRDGAFQTELSAMFQKSDEIAGDDGIEVLE